MRYRLLIIAYATIAYLAFLLAFLAFAGLLLGLLPPRAGASPPVAILTNLSLLLLFGAQHSLMARQSFKRAWRRVMPQAAERSSYVLLSSLLLGLIALGWQALPTPLWTLPTPWLRALVLVACAGGVALALAASFMIDHWELTGLRQAGAALRGQPAEAPSFRTPALYRSVRHPLQLGILIAVWAAPTLTVDRLLLAAGLTVYILVGLAFEERDLLRAFGARYQAYRAEVPMLLPRLRRTSVADRRRSGRA